MAKSDTKRTSTPEEIKAWAEKREGRPAKVKGTNDLLRISFPGFSEEKLEDLSWQEFFEIFKENDLEFIYQEETEEGETSRFFKFVEKED